MVHRQGQSLMSVRTRTSDITDTLSGCPVSMSEMSGPTDFADKVDISEMSEMSGPKTTAAVSAFTGKPIS
jgi:hypothetical protein